jgi:hypothetical protein
MLVYGYRTWTRDKTIKPDTGAVVLWDHPESDLVSIEYKADKKIVKLERKTLGSDSYWWGSETTIETKPKKTDSGSGSATGSGSGSGSASGSGSGSSTAAKGSGSGSGSGSQVAANGSGSGSGSGSAAKPEEEEVSRKTKEFPVGESAEKLVKAYAAARALRELGVPNDEQKKDYKLNDAKNTITVTFKDHSTKAFLIGGAVYGGADKYAVDQQNGKAYVLSRELLAGIEIGESNLHLTDPRGFETAKIAQVTIDAGPRSKTGARIETKNEKGDPIKTWGDPDTKQANQTFANFIDNANNLKPTEYDADLKVSDLTPVVKFTYKDDRGALLGTLALYKHEKPGTLPEGQELDPANPPKGELEYYIVTEKTRVPGLVRKDTAQRAENDIEVVFSNRPPEPVGSGSAAGSGKSIDPHGNPFGAAGKAAIKSGAKGKGSAGSATLPPAGSGSAPGIQAKPKNLP